MKYQRNLISKFFKTLASTDVLQLSNLSKLHIFILAPHNIFRVDKIETNLWINTNERVCLGVEFLLQRNNDGLEVLHRLVFDVICHLGGTEVN